MPVPESVKLSLAEHLGRFPARLVTLPWLEPGGKPVTAELMLTTPAGQAVNKNGFNGAAWKSALKKAGVPAARRVNGCHALRHYYASVLLHGGSDIKALSEYLGHHSAAFTLATYTHLMPAAADRARQAIDAARAGTADGPVTAQEGQI